MGTDPYVGTDRLLAGILDAQLVCNNLLGSMFNHMINTARQPSTNSEMDNWKAANKELVQRCGDNKEALNDMLVSYLNRVLDDVEKIDDMESDFEIREFIDRHCQSVLQISGVISILGQISS